MSIERLYNHNAVVWRATVTRDEFGGTTETWSELAVPVGSNGYNCRPNQDWSGDQQDHGPGEQQSAKRQWFLHKDFDIAERDVLEVYEGPEAPLFLDVLSEVPTTRITPAVHHIEINVEVRSDALEVAS